MKLDSLSILIPAYNDAATIETVVTEAIAIAKKVASCYEILVIDDGSTDDTYSHLNLLKQRDKKIVIQRHRVNQGYGKTIKKLYSLAKYHWLFSAPGDYQVGVKELLTLLPYVKQSDYIIGWRRNRHDPLSRLVQSNVYNMLIRVLFGISVHDINSVRLIKRAVVKSVSLMSDSAFVDAELTIQASRNGYIITEIPISHRARTGSIGGGGKWWTILPTIWEMVRYKFTN